MAIGEQLKLLRQEKNQTQQQMADRLGISRAAYSHFENNRNEPDYATILKLADYFGVSVDFLLRRREISLDKKNEIAEPTEQFNSKAKTVAAHIDDDVTDEGLAEILDYIEYIKSKHKKED